MEDSNYYFIFVERNDNSPDAHISKIVDNRFMDVQADIVRLEFFRENILKAIEGMTIEEYYLLRRLFVNYIPLAVPDNYFGDKENLLQFIMNLVPNEASLNILNSVASNWYLVKPIFLDICKRCNNNLPNDVIDNISDVDYLYEKLLQMKLQSNFDVVLENLTMS